MKMSEGIVTCKEKVEKLLSRHFETRDSDKLLWIAYLVSYHGLREILDDDSYFKFKNMIMNENTPTVESITRIRRKFQEDGKYEGNNRAQRMAEQSAVRQVLR